MCSFQLTLFHQSLLLTAYFPLRWVRKRSDFMRFLQSWIPLIFLSKILWTLHYISRVFLILHSHRSLINPTLTSPLPSYIPHLRPFLFIDHFLERFIEELIEIQRKYENKCRQTKNEPCDLPIIRLLKSQTVYVAFRNVNEFNHSN